MHRRATSATVQASSIRITAAITRALSGTCTVVLAVILHRRHREAFRTRSCKLPDAYTLASCKGMGVASSCISRHGENYCNVRQRPFELTFQARISRPIHLTNTRRTSRDRALGLTSACLRRFIVRNHLHRSCLERVSDGSDTRTCKRIANPQGGGG